MKIKNINESGLYRTSDLALAAVLSLYHPVESLERQDPRRVVFVFPKTTDISAAAESYWRAEIQVEPRKYFDQIKHLKSLIYDQ